MIRAFSSAVGQLFDGRILGLLGACALLCVGCFVVVWIGVGWTLTHTAVFETRWLEGVVDVLGGLLTLGLSWLLFPLLASAFLGLFLEPVARAVEARHYPQLPKAPGLPFFAGVLASVRFLALVVVVNVALLLLLVSALPAYPFAYLLANGFLLGREYFELVALRRLSPAAARDLRRRTGGELLLLGTATAGLSLVPLANFLAPVLMTMVFVHRYQAWTARSGQPAGGG